MVSLWELGPPRLATALTLDQSITGLRLDEWRKLSVATGGDIFGLVPAEP